MEHVLEFRNISVKLNWVYADMYLDNKFIFRLSDTIQNLFTDSSHDIGLYNFFKEMIYQYIFNNYSWLNDAIDTNTCTMH